MLKSTVAITIVAIGLKDVKALWALLFVLAVAIAGAMHLLFHQRIGAGHALRDFALIDTVGCIAYLIGVALF